MTGLRSRARDPHLPARAGEEALSPPGEADLLALVEEHLLRPGVPAPRAATWQYARWKPGVSITCAYGLAFEDGETELVVLKRYTGDKARVLADRSVTVARPHEASTRLEGRQVLPEKGTVLWTPLGDRELGLHYLLDLERFPKLLRSTGLVDPGLVRRRRTRFELLRYKPERRAVYRVEVRLRDEARSRLGFAARVLPTAEVERIVRHRTAFAAAGGDALAPPLACAHERHGILVEPWLDVRAEEPDAFEAAGTAGVRLAALHGLPVPDALPASAARPRRRFARLFGAEPELLRLADAVPRDADGPADAPVWIHGDFHPDQLARGAAGELLMDLDCLALGDACVDLASWIADHLFERPAAGWEEAAAPLLAGYAQGGGRPPAEDRLRARVAEDLRARAAASVRRLEQDAYGRARRGLERALDLSRR